MIAGVHRRVCRVTVPQLPHCRRPVSNHVPPARIGVNGRQLVRQIDVPVASKQLHGIADAHIADSEMVPVLVYTGHYVAKHILLPALRHDAEAQRDEIGCHGVVGVIPLLAVEELGVVRLLDLRERGLISRHVSVIAGIPGKLDELVHRVAEYSGLDDLAVRLAVGVFGMYHRRLFGRDDPIPVLVKLHVEDAVVQILGRDRLEPRFHGGVIGLDAAVVPVSGVQHVSHVQKYDRCRHVVVVDGPVARGHYGDAVLLAHGRVHVIHPFAVKRRAAEYVGLSPYRCGPVPHPPLALVALRTVYRHTAIVAAYAPEYVMKQLVEPLVRAVETPCHRHLVIRHLADNLARYRRLSDAAYLHVAESMVREHRCPSETAVPGGNVFVGRQRGSEVGLVYSGAVREELLGVTDDHGRVLEAGESHLRESHHILLQIHEPAAVRELPHCLAGDIVLLGHVIHGHGLHMALGVIQGVHMLPDEAVGVPKLIPAGHLQAGVIILSVKFVVHGDGAMARAHPRGIGDDLCSPAVRISHFKHRLDTGIFNAAQCAAVQGLVSPGAEEHCQHIVPLAQQVGDIVCPVIQGLVEQHRRMGEHVPAHPLPVDGGIPHAESAEIQLGLPDIAVQREILAEIPCGEVVLVLFELPPLIDPYPLRPVPGQ